MVAPAGAVSRRQSRSSRRCPTRKIAAPWVKQYDFRFVEGEPGWGSASAAEPNSFSKLWIGDRVPRKIDALSLMSMSDAFFGRIFHARRELVPFGTVSITTYFHADADDLAAEDITRVLAVADAKIFHKCLWRPERRIVVAERTPARNHDANRVFQGVREHTGLDRSRSLIESLEVAALMSEPDVNKARIALLGMPIEIGASQAGTLMGPDALRTAGIARVLEQLEFSVEDLGNLARPQGHSGRAAAAPTPNITTRSKPGFGCSASAPTSWRAPAPCRSSWAAITRCRWDRSTASRATGRNRAGRCSCCGSMRMPTTTRRTRPSPATCTACPRRSCAAKAGSTICSAISRARRSRRTSSICSASARSIRWKRSWCTSAVSRSPTCARIDEFGVGVLIRRVIERVKAKNGVLHLSFDVDFLDPAVAPGVGTTVPGGATYREAHLIMELLHDSDLVRSVDIVELNPFLDERGRTARVAVELIGSLFGLQITDRRTPTNAVLPAKGSRIKSRKATRMQERTPMDR